jgi:hypothetical protein
MEDSSVDMVLGFSKERGVEDLKIEPKLHCYHFLEVWHLLQGVALVLLVKTCISSLMMLA